MCWRWCRAWGYTGCASALLPVQGFALTGVAVTAIPTLDAIADALALAHAGQPPRIGDRVSSTRSGCSPQFIHGRLMHLGRRRSMTPDELALDTAPAGGAVVRGQWRRALRIVMVRRERRRRRLPRRSCRGLRWLAASGGWTSAAGRHCGPSTCAARMWNWRANAADRMSPDTPTVVRRVLASSRCLTRSQHSSASHSRTLVEPTRSSLERETDRRTCARLKRVGRPTMQPSTRAYCACWVIFDELPYQQPGGGAQAASGPRETAAAAACFGMRSRAAPRRPLWKSGDPTKPRSRSTQAWASRWKEFGRTTISSQGRMP